MHKHPDPHRASKPFLKWSGGKQRLLPNLLPRLPAGKRLIEPFVGAGSVFLASSFDSFVINDANADLVSVWSALKSRPTDFMKRASALFVEDNRNMDAYLRLRIRFNELTDRYERAVLLPYLNRFGFNGLFRVNLSGQLNTPYGHPRSLPAFPWQQMEAAHDKLARATIMCGGFAATMELAGAGDVVYCDPPYLESQNGASFTGYTADRFTEQHHQLLVEAAVDAASRGATVVISNHDTPQARHLYRGWHIDTFEAHRSVAASVGSRGLVRELTATLPWPSLIPR